MSSSVAHVYKSVVCDSWKEVTVKAQRPDVLAAVIKDFYILRRATTVYQGD